MLFVNDHVMDRIKLYYIEFHIYFQRNKSKISRITDDPISYERNKGIYRESSENGHNWETEGKLASRNSAFPTSENNNLPVCTCSMHRIAR